MTVSSRLSGPGRRSSRPPAGPAAERGGHQRRDVSAAVVLAAYVRRDLADGRIFRLSLLLDLGYAMVNLLIFLFISRVLRHPGGDGLAGASSYFDFVAPGLAYLLVVQAACTQVTARIQQDQRSGTLEQAAAEPISPAMIAAGTAITPVTLGFLRSMVYLAAAVILLGLDTDDANWCGVLVVLVLGASAAMSIGIVVAAVAAAFTHGGAGGRLVLVGVGLLSGIYFPIAVLPEPLRWIGALLPTRMTVDALRAAIAGREWLGLAGLLAVTVALLLPLSSWLFGRGLRRCRRLGTLTRG